MDAYSNWETRLEKAPLRKSIVRCFDSRSVGIELKRSSLGALNWATGETVAVKEIQLSSIPKGELGEIMVRSLVSISYLMLIFHPVRD
jgi:hypothetical protein